MICKQLVLSERERKREREKFSNSEPCNIGFFLMQITIFLKCEYFQITNLEIPRTFQNRIYRPRKFSWKYLRSSEILKYLGSEYLIIVLLVQDDINSERSSGKKQCTLGYIMASGLYRKEVNLANRKVVAKVWSRYEHLSMMYSTCEFRFRRRQPSVCCTDQCNGGLGRSEYRDGILNQHDYSRWRYATRLRHTCKYEPLYAPAGHQIPSWEPI